MTSQQYTLTQSTPPTEEPISYEEAKVYGWVTDHDDDALIDQLGQVVRRRFEELSGIQLVTATWKMYLDCFPEKEILIPKSPLIAVSSITYVDNDGATQTWSSSLYQVDAVSKPGRICPAWGESWPSTRYQMNAVCITFTAGFGAATAVPYEFKHRLWQATKYRYDNRDITDEKWLDQFLSQHWPGWIF